MPSKKLKYLNGGHLINEVRSLSTDLIVPFSSAEEYDKACDKFIVILLEILSIVVEEKGWTDVKPIQLFEGVWGEVIRSKQYEQVYERFKETESLIEKFRTSEGKDKAIYKKELISRGIIQQ